MSTQPKRFRKRPLEITAVQWTGWLGVFRAELAAVQLPSSGITGDSPLLCHHCGESRHDHGEIETNQGRVDVCPGDWIITAPDGEQYPCKPGVFADTYEEILPLATVKTPA